jgi:hypothetical protein
MYLSETKLTDINLLRDRIWGEVITPYDDAYAEACGAFNVTLQQNPAAVVYAESAEDVAAAVRFARKNDMRLAPQTTGHNAGPLMGALTNSILLKTSRMKGVEIDAANRTARVQAGTVWGEVSSKLEGTGLAALHGSSPTVGVVGYSLTGGVGWQARKHGMQTNHVTAIDLVDEFGEVIRASATENPDLFWALRGGGGNFGIVTAIEFDLVATPQVNAGLMFWPWERAQEVLDTWLEMTPDLPEDITSVFRIIQMPPFEEIPEFLRGRQFAIVNAAVLGDRDYAAKWLAPLRALEPEFDTFEDVDASALAFLHMDPEDPMPYNADHMLLDEVTPETARELVAVAGAGSGSPLAVVELRHMGGALTRCDASHGARNTLPAKFMFFGIAPVIPELPPELGPAALARVREVLEPGKAQADYLNFTETKGTLADFFDPHTHAKIKAIKAKYDESNLFQGNFEV